MHSYLCLKPKSLPCGKQSTDAAIRATVAKRAAARLSMGFCGAPQAGCRGRGFSSMGGSQWLSDHLYQLIEGMREYEVEPSWVMARKSLWAIAGRAGVSEKDFLMQQLIAQKQQTEIHALRGEVKDLKEKYAVNRHALLLGMLIAKYGNDIRGLLQFFLEEFEFRYEFVENDWNRNWDLILEKNEKFRLKLQAECKWPRAKPVSSLVEMYDSLAHDVHSSELEASVELGRKGGYFVVS